MRIVGGDFKGRPLVAPKGMATRPTTDRTRESLFNILTHRDGDILHGARVIDLFAGSGALGCEAISRGASFCLFVETAAGARA
ncbi:MAG: RsmD family RNA methyltransferase, partial [Pseudomonadota bacterium]